MFMASPGPQPPRNPSRENNATDSPTSGNPCHPAHTLSVKSWMSEVIRSQYEGTWRCSGSGYPRVRMPSVPPARGRGASRHRPPPVRRAGCMGPRTRKGRPRRNPRETAEGGRIPSSRRGRTIRRERTGGCGRRSGRPTVRPAPRIRREGVGEIDRGDPGLRPAVQCPLYPPSGTVAKVQKGWGGAGRRSHPVEK